MHISLTCVRTSADLPKLPRSRTSRSIFNAIPSGCRLLSFLLGLQSLDSPDHQSYVAYPIDGKCLSIHPCAIPTLFMESYNSFAGTGFPAQGQIMLSNGDTTGYGFHGDFVNGFSTGSEKTKSSLVRGLEECGDALNRAAGGECQR